jgi:hypothetical protein
MKKFFLLPVIVILFCASLSLSGYAQSIGINADGSAPDPSAMLDVKNVNKGLLIPRVALTGTSDVATIASPAVSLLVYNTATTATVGTAVAPGYYYWSGSAWLKFNTGAGSASVGSWLLIGNAGTVDGTNFIGTTDNMPFNLKVNNQKAGRIDANTTIANTFWGYQAGNSNTTGYENTANGQQSLYSNTTGYLNTATGGEALYSNTEGRYNTANGATALNLNTLGDYNTATGFSALQKNTIGNNNTANGANALFANTEGLSNTANGYSALVANTTGGANTANGAGALAFNISGYSNTANGNSALYGNTEGANNTASGVYALASNTTGSNNTAFGYLADVSTGGLTNSTALGNGAIVNASNTVQIGNSDVTDVYFGSTVGATLHAAAYNTPSDKRFKYNIQNNVPGLDFIKKLQPVTYYFDEQKLAEYTNTGIVNNSIVKPASYDGEKQLHTGFLAQDVEKIANQLGYSFDGVKVPVNDKDHYSLAYSQFIMPLVKSVQEQQQIIEDQNKEIDSQAEQIKNMNEKIETLTKAVDVLTHK